MVEHSPPPTAELLLQHATWLRRLAGYLVREGLEADDVLQETWEAVLVSPPDPRRPPRPWLARVLHNAIRSAARASSRRRAREKAGAGLDGQAPGAEELLIRMQLHEQLARLITALEEPYRTTLLMKFYDGRTAADIARAQDIPPGTVRWRLNEGLRRLRQRLDELHGDRPTWRAVLVPLAAPESARSPASAWPLPGQLAVTAGATAALAVVAVMIASSGHPPRVAPAPVPGAATAPAAPASGAVSRPTSPPRPGPPTTEEQTMSNENLKRVATFLGVALPALVAGAAQDDLSDPKIRQGVDMCVQMREQIFECKEAFAEVFVARRNPPPEQREALLRKALEEITKDGSGPLEPRQKVCAAMVKPGPPPTQERIDAMKKKLQTCGATTDCQARVACLSDVLRPGEGKSVK
jgi:RNA polymerase sigma-70 factor (ECF subfamily)